MNVGAPTIEFRRRRLPHWLVAEHAYFVTLCRKGSLPARVAAELRAKRARVARDLRDRAPTAERSDTSRSTGKRPADAAATVARDLRDRASDAERSDTSRSTGLRRTDAPATVARDVPDRADDHEDWESRRLAESQRRFLEIDAILDAAARSRRDLCVPEVSAVILGNLDWLRGRGWRIWAATLMPSHMHLVMRNTEGRNDALCSDLALFLSWTARQANTLLGTQGSFWQPEPFDHWCRDADAWLRSVGYTLHNPVKARLCSAWRDWPHTVADPEVEGLVP